MALISAMSNYVLNLVSFFLDASKNNRSRLISCARFGFHRIYLLISTERRASSFDFGVDNFVLGIDLCVEP